MGYRERKIKAESKRKKAKWILLCALSLLLAIVVIFSCFVPPESWKYNFSKPKVGSRRAGEMRIHFLDVGQGDCTVIELPDNKIMLIDGGDDRSSTKKTVMRYLNALSVKTIDYLVVTHTDGDHCGSLEEVFRYKKVLNAYLPPSFSASEVEYAETYAAAVKENCNLYSPSRSINLSVTEGETPYTLSFLYPYTDVETWSNENSAVIWLDYVGQSALFCGDAPSSVEKFLISEDENGLFAARGVDLSSTEILKAAHHGSENSTCAELLDYTGATHAILSCGKNNVYGHPSEGVLQRLEARSIAVHRTDEKEHIVATVRLDGSLSIKYVKA